MNIKGNRQRRLIITIGIILVCLKYVFLYDIPESNIINYITKHISKVTQVKFMDVQLHIIDQFDSGLGKMILFETPLKDAPAGYAVFEKDFIFNRYHNSKIILYDNPKDYVGDSDVLIDLKHGYVFRFTEAGIAILNCIKRYDIERYIFEYCFFALMAIIICNFILLRRQRDY